jgi:hypothetical protein
MAAKLLGLLPLRRTCGAGGTGSRVVRTRGGLKLRVLSLVEEDGDPYTGLLMVEPA